jgi:hypothetical protein
MENKFRNELEITLGGEKILLRPTFENIAAMENNVGSVAYLTWKFSRGIRSVDGKSLASDAAVRSMPSMNEAAKIIYYNQAAHKQGDPTLKKYNLEEIWQLILEEGAGVAKHIILFLGRITAGNKAIDIDELSEGEKKS